MNYEKYQQFKVEDFIEDENFQRYSLLSTKESLLFWNKLALTCPEKEVQIKEAKQLLQSIHQHYQTALDKIPSAKAEASFHKIRPNIETSSKKNRSKNNRLLLLSIAASLIFLIGVIGLYTFDKSESNKLTWTTSNGDRQEIQLPDHSIVQLNANSSLYFFPNKWATGERKVWLNGEAYFDVQKKKEGTKFMVFANQVEVAVLGTQFNVKSRGENTEVVLNEGKIELAVANQKISMNPGDFISYSPKAQKIASRQVKASDYTSWKDGITVFNDQLSKVASELEVLYGVEFVIENQNLKNRKIQLSAPSDSLNQVLEILKLMYPDDIHIKKEQDKIILF